MCETSSWSVTQMPRYAPWCPTPTSTIFPPTGRRVEIPLVAIVNFREGKVAHEHIYWDQASVLVQLGLLDSAGLPVAGAETARKVLEPHLPSNLLIHRG